MRWYGEPIKGGFTFKDVLLRPGFSKADSRLDADLYVDFCGFQVLPIMVANMLDLATLDMFSALASFGIVVPLNRINRTVEDRMQEARDAKLRRDAKFHMPIAAAVGLNDREAIDALSDYVDVFFLDVAYAYTKNILDEVDWIKHTYDKKLVVGNVATDEAVIGLTSLGADYVKVGVGSGSVCTTRIETGCGVPQLSAIAECSLSGNVIADGGIKNAGDAVKALAAGADLVMVGGLFAGTDECYDDGTGTKMYRGLASSAAKANKRGIIPEGVSVVVSHKGPALKVAERLIGGLRQGMGIVGAANIEELKNAKFQRVTSNTTLENLPHIDL